MFDLGSKRASFAAILLHARFNPATPPNAPARIPRRACGYKLANDGTGTLRLGARFSHKSAGECGASTFGSGRPDERVLPDCSAQLNAFSMVADYRLRNAGTVLVRCIRKCPMSKPAVCFPLRPSIRPSVVLSILTLQLRRLSPLPSLEAA